MKIVTWNVNGIRAAERAGFLDWFKDQKADVVCLQETKAHPSQLSAFLLHPEGYQSYWQSAQKAGYSGVAVYTKKEPDEIIEGIGKSEFDSEGRVLGVRFKDLMVVSAYFPNAQRDHKRLPYKLAFCKSMLAFCKKWHAKGVNVVLCGDYNIAHREIDLRNPKQNQDNSGFLPEERAWMDHFLSSGYVDTFRSRNPEPGHYTWWSYRPGVRAKNIGWRIDYHCVNEELDDRVKKCWIRPEVTGSDHCPVVLELKS